MKIKTSSPFLTRHKNFSMLFLTVVTSFCLNFPSTANAQEQQERPGNSASNVKKLDLARRYFDARSDITALQINNQASETPDKAAIDKMVLQVMATLSKSKDWNPSNQNWEKVRQILGNAIKEMSTQIELEKKQGPDKNQINNALQNKFSNQLSESDLEKIVGFYESTTGINFVKTHTQIYAAYPGAMLKFQKMAQDGKKIDQTTTIDIQQFQILVGLFSEYLAYQLTVLDPGPGHDRSGLQALPMVTAMAIRVDFDRLEQIWNELPKDAQQEVIAYRESPNWKSERAALVSSLEELEKFTKSGAFMKKIAAAMAGAIGSVQGLLPPN
jgi:hypothetical protein